MNKVDFGSSVETNSDCGSDSSVHAWETQMTLIYTQRHTMSVSDPTVHVPSHDFLDPS